MSCGTLAYRHTFRTFAYMAFTSFGSAFQSVFSFVLLRISPVAATPQYEYYGLGSSHFARRYFGNRFFFLFLRLLRCFSSPGSLLKIYVFNFKVMEHYLHRVSPFGHLWIIVCLPLPTAFRSLPRPSSAVGAKASSLCSY